MAILSREPCNPTPEDQGIIKQFTHLASIAIERTQSQEALRQSETYLAAVAIERKRAEEALRQSESRFEGILNIAEDAIISVDSSQRILLFNRGAEKVFGYAATEVIGKPLDVLFPQRFAQAHRSHIEEFGRSPDTC